MRIFVRSWWSVTSHGEHSYQIRDKIDKDRVGGQLNSIRANYRKVVDASKCSEGGRSVFTFFRLCENVWGGSPAVKSISSRRDTSRSSNDEGAEESDAEEEGSLNSSGEKIEGTAKASNIATEAGAASFSDT